MEAVHMEFTVNIDFIIYLKLGYALQTQQAFCDTRIKKLLFLEATVCASETNEGMEWGGKSRYFANTQTMAGFCSVGLCSRSRMIR